MGKTSLLHAAALLLRGRLMSAQYPGNRCGRCRGRYTHTVISGVSAKGFVCSKCWEEMKLEAARSAAETPPEADFDEFRDEDFLGSTWAP